MHPRVLARVVDWVTAHRQFSVEFENPGPSIWVSARTRKAIEFVRLAVAVIDCYYIDPSSELTFLVITICATGSKASLISLSVSLSLSLSLCPSLFFSGGSHILLKCYKEYLRSGYTKLLTDYPKFDVWLLKSVSGRLHCWCLGPSTPSQWSNFLSSKLKGQSIVFGFRPGIPSGWRLRQATSHYLLGCGRSLFVI